MWNYDFDVPNEKKFRVIVHTDCKNEADDQFAVAHHLMTPKFMVKGIIAGHFWKKYASEGKLGTAQQSYDEIIKIMRLMNIEGYCPVLMGADRGLIDVNTPINSDGAKSIIEEAMKDDKSPLYVVFLGAITDLACAILMEPRIVDRMTAVWIGGGEWPDGGNEFNLMHDIKAANIVFSSEMPLWQVPKDVYKQISVSLTELQVRVKPYGEIGKYLFEQMVALNDECAGNFNWPHGETWALGDQATITVLLDEYEKRNYVMKPAPCFNEDMTYIHNLNNREIRVYHTLDSRMTMEDFYAKLALNFPK